MSATSFEAIRYRGWDAYALTRDPLQFIFVPQIGGRLMNVLWEGRELFYVHPDLEGRCHRIPPQEDVRIAKQTFGFPLWGGDKTWLAPQDRWTGGVPFFDLDSGPYSIDWHADKAAVRMTSGRCRETGLVLERIVQLGEQAGGWSVTHRMTNCGERPASWGLWDVTMVHRPGVVMLPMSAGSRFEDGIKAFSNEGQSDDLRPRVLSRRRSGMAVDCREPLHFKYGSDAESGRAVTLLQPDDAIRLLYVKAVPTFHPQPYGHDCVIEVYNSPSFDYFELEVHGPVVDLAPGQSFELTSAESLASLNTALDAVADL